MLKLWLYYYPKTNTNMFVITCRLNIPEVEDSPIRKFLPPRCKVAKLGAEGKIFSQMVFTIFLPPLRPFDFAQDMLCGRHSEFPLRLCADRRTSFPSAVWERACKASQTYLKFVFEL
jgi:hypothetical protein